MNNDNSSLNFKIVFEEMFRKGSEINFKTFLETAQTLNIDIDLKMLKILNDKLGHRSNIRLCPHFITAFIISYLKDKKCKNILDPWVGIGSILVPVVEKLSPDNAIGFVNTEEELKIINGLKQEIDCKIGYKNQLLDDLKINFDVIVGFPPWNVRRHSPHLELNTDDGFVRVKDTDEKLQILRSLQFLNENGVGIFLLDMGFMFRKSRSNVLSNLEKFGFNVVAALEIPHGTFTDTALGGVLVIIEKTDQDTMFVGELSSNSSYNKILLKNLNSQKNGDFPNLGRIIKRKTFISFNNIFNETEIKKIAKRSNLKNYPLLEISKEVNNFHQKKGFQDKINSVYLPIIGNSPTVNSLENLTIKPQNYIQIVLKSNKVNSDYLSKFFNSDLGVKIRKSLETGGVIPRINKKALDLCEVYLPDLKTQQEVVENDAIIRDIQTQLKIEQKNLWKYPKKVNQVSKKLEKIDMRFNIQDWINSLPFPLASILWAYESEIDRSLKFKYLLRFFEAFSQFNLTLILSSLTRKKPYYNENFKKCYEKANEKWFLEPNFGSWNYLGMNFSAEIRRILNKNDLNSDICLEMFGNPNNDFLRVITSKSFYNILKEANNHRNWWDGHDTPAIPEEECDRRMEILSNLVNDLKELTTDLYDSILFFLPIEGGCISGDCRYKIRMLKGPNSHFKKDQIKVSPSTEMLDSTEIYFINENQLEPIKLFKFLKIMKTPEREPNAYFFNRVEGDEVRLVSYHSKIKFEERIPSNQFDLLDILSEL